MKVHKLTAGKYAIQNEKGILVGTAISKGRYFWTGKVFGPETVKESGWNPGEKSGIVKSTKEQYLEAFFEKFNEKGERK